MARGRRAAVSAYERRKWLEDLEKGKGITEITRAARRDIRIVKRHIEIAQQDRELAQARGDFIRSRLEMHQDDLLDEVKRIQEEVTRHPSRSLEPLGHLDMKIHHALREHTKTMAFRDMIEAYCSVAQEYHDCRSRINEELTKKETELVSTLPVEVETHPWTDALMELLERYVQIGTSLERSYGQKAVDGGYLPDWGEFALIRSPVNKDYLPPIRKAHQELRSHGEKLVPILKDLWLRLKELGKEIVNELDVFLLKRLVPGRCGYCPA